MVTVDPDKAGLLSASFLATLVMGVCFFYQKVHWADVAFRVAVVFLFSYVVTFLLVLFLRRVGERELARVGKATGQGVAAESQGGPPVPVAPGQPEPPEKSREK